MGCKTMGICEVNKPLVPLKLSLFGISGATHVMRTFLYLYLEQIGLTLKEITIVNSIVPVLQLISITITGFISEKTGKNKMVLYSYLFIGLVIGNAFLLFRHSDNIPTSNEKRKLLCSDHLTNTILRNFTSEKDSRSLDKLHICSFECSYNSSIELMYIFCNYDDNILCGSINNSMDHKHYVCSAVELNEEFTGRNLSKIGRHRCDNICKTYPEKNKKDLTLIVTILICFIAIVYRTSYNNAFTLLDATAMSMSKIHNSDFGRQTIWISLGVISMPVVAGCIIEATSTMNIPSYEIAFIVFDVLIIVVILSVWKLDMKPKPKTDQVGKRLFSLLRDLDIIVFLMVVYTLSMVWGFKMDFISLYLEDLGASSLLMSLGQLVYGLSGLPFMFFSNWWIEKIGSENVLVLAYAAYVLTYTAYSYLLNPWWSLLCELMAIFTYHLMWVAVVVRNYELVPGEIQETVQSFLATLHFGIGAASGSLLGGFVMDKYGGRRACRVLAIFALVCGVLYVSYTWVRRNWNKINTGTAKEQEKNPREPCKRHDALELGISTEVSQGN